MKLRDARVTNFRSVEDSGKFGLERVACLVGKNEAGKTAILQALAGLNPHPSTPYSYDVERDYPRAHLAQYAKRHGDKGAVVVATTWVITPEELAEIHKAFGVKALERAEVLVSRSYGDTHPRWDVPVNLDACIKFLIAEAQLSDEEAEPLRQAANTEGLKTALRAIEERTLRQERLLETVASLPGGSITGAIMAHLILPQFMYFSYYDRMKGQIRLDTLDARRAGTAKPPIEPGDLVFVDFLELAGISPEEIASATTYEGLNARCEAASLNITRQLREYWTQNPFLDIDIRVTKGHPGDEPPFDAGVVARARVKNNLHGMTVPFSERSAGFIWFFSFLVKFAQVEAGTDEVVLLLDEPGLTLHGKAQADLLRYFYERLAPDYQVIFTTHSPFMVPADKLPAVRLVEDRVVTKRPGVWESDGTKVRDDAMATDRDTLFPLQGALGYDITQTLFVGKHNLLVEGPGDVVYLQAWSSALERRKRTKLDSRWTICPAGGLDKIQSFVSLFFGANLDIAALTDYATTDRKRLENIRQNSVLAEERLLTFATLLGQDEADVEDVFSPVLYAELLNAAFALPKKVALAAGELDQTEGGTPRLLKRAEAAFRLMPPSTPEFNHYAPASWLLLHPEMLEGDSLAIKETLDRAETVIKALNKLL